MKKACPILLCTLLLIMATAAFPCGDKLLRLNHIHRSHAGKETTVLVFARPDSSLEYVSALDLAKAFHDEGYHLLLATNVREVALALQSGAADVVIADILDVPSIEALAATKKPLIIPAVSRTTALTVAMNQYAAVIKVPAKAGKFLDAIDRAYDSKLARQKPKLLDVSAQ